MVIAYFVRHGEAETNRNGILSSKHDSYPLTWHSRTLISETARITPPHACTPARILLL